MLDLIHRIYEADESFRSLDFMVHTKLYFSHIVLQILLGTVTPIVLLAMTQVVKLPDLTRKRIYCAVRLPDADRYLRHALERGHRRPALLEELSRIYDLQDGLCHEGRIADGNHPDDSSVRNSLDPGEAAAAMAGEGFACQRGSGAVVQPHSFRPQRVEVLDDL